MGAIDTGLAVLLSGACAIGLSFGFIVLVAKLLKK